MPLDPNRPGRLRCEVIGCNRTAPADKYEPETKIICGKCWRAGSNKAQRALWGKFRREADLIDARLSALAEAGQPIPEVMAARYDRCARTAHAIWDDIRTSAIIQRGMGI